MNLLYNVFYKKKKDLEQEIERYLCCVTDVCSAFNTGLQSYLKGDMEAFEKCHRDTSAIERRADECLKRIKYKLHANMLFPDFQKDITVIFNNIDDVINISNQVLIQMDIESPVIPRFLHKYFLDLVGYSCKTVNELVLAAEHLFDNKTMIEDHANKIYFYQAEANRIREKIESTVFQSAEISDLAHKSHISYFARKIFSVPEQTRTVAKKMVVYVIKSNSAEN